MPQVSHNQLEMPVAASSADIFENLAQLPAMRRFFRLMWRLFGLNVAVLSADGRNFIVSGQHERVNPFCAALNRDIVISSACIESDRAGLAGAIKTKSPVCYQCFAGLREFVVPIIIDHQVVAIVLSGQVLDRPPTLQAWRHVRARLQQMGMQSKHIPSLQQLFMRSRAMSKTMQRDVVTLLSLFTGQIARLESLKTRSHARQPLVERAKALMDQRCRERLTLADIAAALNVSSRHLTRVFKSVTATTVLDYIKEARLERACDLLDNTGDTCAGIAFASGFGSIQQFNRIFKQHKRLSPTDWRKRVANPGMSARDRPANLAARASS